MPMQSFKSDPERVYYIDSEGSGLVMYSDKVPGLKLGPRTVVVPGSLTNPQRLARTDLLQFEGAQIKTSDTNVLWEVKTGAWSQAPSSVSEAGNGEAFIVYGATPGGIAAAVTAAELGVKVILLSDSERLGGMMGWGITHTDVDPGGVPQTCTGFPKKFLAAIGARETNVAKNFPRYPRISADGFPSWFIKRFGEVVGEQKNITVHYGCTDPVVQKTGAHLSTVTVMKNGARAQFTGWVFGDACYTGDLAAAAGITMAVGRESTAKYGEALAGIMAPSIPASWGANNISPYVIDGNVGSGLLPGVDAAVGTIGAGDGKVMTWNYRLFVTTNAGTRIPFPAPNMATYTAAVAAGTYELLARAMAANPANFQVFGSAGSTGVVTLYSNALSSNYFDLNGRPGVSTNYLNSAELLDYLQGTEAQRVVIRERMMQYILGLFYWIKNSGDPRIPAALVTNIATYGLVSNELQGYGGLSPELYVREPRRGVGDYVMTQAAISLANGVTDEIAYVAYWMDSPQVRLVNDGGVTKQEGAVLTTLTRSQFGARIPYRVLLPKASEADNLLLIGCPSVSQVVWRGIRLEPTLMQMGQAAGIAAALAIQNKTSVHAVDTARIKKIQDLQEIWSGLVLSTDPAAGNEGTITYTGAWTDDATGFGAVGPTSTGKSNGGNTTRVARFQHLVRETGQYLVEVVYVPQIQTAGVTAVPAVVSHADGAANRAINMEYPGGNGGREFLGAFTFRAKGGGAVSDDYTEIACTGMTGKVVISAVILHRLS